MGNTRARLGAGAEKALRWAALWPAVVVLAFIAVNSLLFTSTFAPNYDEILSYRVDWLPTGLLACLAALAVAAFARQALEKIPLKTLERLLYIYAAAFGVLWVCSVRSHPVDDALSVMTHAGEMLGGDYSALAPSAYLGVYPFQLGLALYEEAWFTLVGAGNYLFLQLLNAGWAVLAYWALVRITAALFNDDSITRLAALLLFFCWPPLFYTTFVYGVLPGLACALLGVLFTLRYLAGHRPRHLVLAGAFAALANVLKNNTLIFAVGIFLVLFVDWLKTGGAKRLALVLALAVCVAGAHLPVRWLYQARSGQDLSGGMPRVLWAAMGLRPSERAPGWYSGVSVGLYEQNGYDAEAAAEAGWAVIRYSLDEFAADPAYAAGFLYEKAVSQWNEPTFAGLWVSHFDNPHDAPLPALAASTYGPGRLNSVLAGAMDAFHLLVYAFSLWLLLARRKTLTLAQLLPALILLGGFVFHMAWEAKSQYTLPYFVLMLPCAAAGLHAAAGWVAGLRERRRRKRAPEGAPAGLSPHF